MPQRVRDFVDRLLVRAWIEPDHHRQLRVLVRMAPDSEREQQRAFADADSAAAFVREWLLEFVRRWERAEPGEAAAASQDEQGTER